MEDTCMTTSHIEEEIYFFRKKLQNHGLYNNLKTLEDIRIFMESHVYAVWDFMSLLKALQRDITGSRLPWTPPNNPVLARFINEIVLDEESDLNDQGEVQSHFEMYLDAMDELGADHNGIDDLISRLQSGDHFTLGMINGQTDERTRDFVAFTLDTVHSQNTVAIAAAFAFGREEIIPEMFLKILKSADPESKRYTKLRYYLQRHIELDGDQHGPLSMRMIEEICGTNEKNWMIALESAKTSISKRIALWDTINEKIVRAKAAVRTHHLI